MSSEVCPFCGKSFKRLKSHLPHCKSAPNSNKTREEEARTSGKDEALDSTRSEIRKRTEPKVTARVKMATETSSVEATVSASPKIKTTITKSKRMKEPKKKDIFTNVESERSPESKSVGLSELEAKVFHSDAELMSSSALFGDLPNLKNQESNGRRFEMTKSTSKQVQTDANPEAEILIPAGKKPTKSAKEMFDNSKKSKKLISSKSAVSVNTQHMNLDQNDLKNGPKIDPWGKREARVTLEDVRATLRRANQNGVSEKKEESSAADIKSESKAQKGTIQQSPSAALASEPREEEVKSQQFSGRFSKMVDCGWSSDSAALGLSMDRFSMGQTAAAPASSMLEAEVSTEAFRKDLEPFSRQSVEKNMELTEEKATRGRGQDGGQRQDGRLTTRVLAPQSFSQVTLRELPDWLVSQSPRRPREVLYLAQRGWRWYYRRYIDVKRGGVGGVAMLLAGYCALSYAWAFPHLKRERWRKYH
ncbi:unnamed protein product [Knipowitschia caucasica]